MSRSVAVVLCLNHTNLGMYSVDLAAKSFFRSTDLKPVFFCAHNPPRRGRARIKRLTGIDIGNRRADRAGKINKRFLFDASELRRFDIVCYWGDFTTNPVVLDKSWGLCERYAELYRSPGESVDRWLRLFGGQAQHRCRISFGQNFQHDALRSNGELRKVFVDNIKQMRGIFPRDSVSTEVVKSAVGNEREVAVANVLDCAFFLDRAPQDVRDDVFISFFGRSDLEEIHKELGMRDLSGASHHPIKGWLSSSNTSIERDFARCMGRIRSAKFAVTDVYHFAINCIREGTPPIVLGRGTRGQVGTLGDYKKKILMQDLGLSDLYIEVEPHESLNRIHARVRETADALLGHKRAFVRARIEAVWRRVEEEKAMFMQFAHGLSQAAT